jgi:hypothetical protein
MVAPKTDRPYSLVLGMPGQLVRRLTALLDITEAQIYAYLNGKGPLTRFRQRKLEVLTGFNRSPLGASTLPLCPFPSCHRPNCQASSPIFSPGRSCAVCLRVFPIIAGENSFNPIPCAWRCFSFMGRGCGLVSSYRSLWPMWTCSPDYSPCGTPSFTKPDSWLSVPISSKP